MVLPQRLGQELPDLGLWLRNDPWSAERDAGQEESQAGHQDEAEGGSCGMVSHFYRWTKAYRNEISKTMDKAGK